MKDYKRGLFDGIPIGLGYFSVSFTFGMIAIMSGVSILQATALSLCNLTSAGQFAAIQLMQVNAPILEVVLATIIINFRYVLMSISLSQKLADKMPLHHKLIVAFGNTDEIFAVAQNQTIPNNFPYLLGLISLPLLGWTMGTFFGATFNSLLPESIQSAFSIALYGMFIAIVIPVAKKVKSVTICILIAISMSSLFYYCPQLHCISPAFSIIICTIVSSAICATIFKVEVNNHD